MNYTNAMSAVRQLPVGIVRENLERQLQAIAGWTPAFRAEKAHPILAAAKAEATRIRAVAQPRTEGAAKAAKAAASDSRRIERAAACVAAKGSNPTPPKYGTGKKAAKGRSS